MPKLTNSFIFKNNEIDILDNLYQQSKENKQFNNLIQYIFSDENINLAFCQLQENYMGYIPGVDNLTIQDIKKDGLASFVRNITLNGTHGYRPKSTIVSKIQKPGFSARPLSVSCMYDKIIQQAIKQVLEPICEAQFINNSYAFRPCYYVENAIARCYQYMQISKLSYVVQVDLNNLYTSVKHNHIINQLWSIGIHDKTLIYILKQILNVDINSKCFSQASGKGIVGSGILFPILANIAFHKFDKWITSQWQENPITNNYYSYTHKNGSKNVGTAYRAMRNTNLKEVYIVRYGSSIRLFCKNYQDAFRISKAVDKWFKKNMSFDNVNSNIINLRKRSMNFLGFDMKLVKKIKSLDCGVTYIKT